MNSLRLIPGRYARSSWLVNGEAASSLSRFHPASSQRWHSTQRKMSGLSSETSSTLASNDLHTSSTSKADLPPHSLMPINMLLRASLVSTISSKPILLNLAISILTYLTQTRITFLRVGKNPIFHSLLKQTFYKHFCAGENGAEVTNTIQNLKDIGFKGVILTYAKEIVVDASDLDEMGKGTKDAKAGKIDMEEAHSPDIESWKEGVLTTVRLLKEDDFLALKLTGAGASVMTSLSKSQSIPKQMSQALEQICTEATTHKVRILVDAEQQTVQPGIDTIALGLMRKYNRPSSPATVYNTYQAYLKSTPSTLSSHMTAASTESFSLGVKLVRGAYMASEPRHLINDTKADTDSTYNSIAESLLQQNYSAFPDTPSNTTQYPAVSLFLATHNKESASLAHTLHKSLVSSHKPTVQSVQYGQLLGMADEVSCSLLQMGRRERNQNHDHNHDQTHDQVVNTTNTGVVPEVYKCLSWGPLEDCLSYLMRRARENQDAVGRSRDEYRAVWAEVRRRLRGVVGL